MKISLALHIVGLVMWLGGLMILTRCMKVFSRSLPQEAEEAISAFSTTIKRIFYGFCLPGALISLLTGLYQVFSMGAAYYMRQGWFHGKLTLILLLFIITFFVARELKKIQNQEILSAKRALALHAASAASLILIVFITILFK